MILAFWTVPCIIFTQFLLLSKLLKAAIQRFRILYGLVLGLGNHAWVHTVALELIWLHPLLILWELFDEEHNLELEHLVPACFWLFILLIIFHLFFFDFLRLLILVIPIFIIKPILLDLIIFIYLLRIWVPFAKCTVFLIMTKEIIIHLEFGFVTYMSKEFSKLNLMIDRQWTVFALAWSFIAQTAFRFVIPLVFEWVDEIYHEGKICFLKAHVLITQLILWLILCETK